MTPSLRPFGLGLDLRGPRRRRKSSSHIPFGEWDQITQRRQHPLIKLASALFHGGLLLLILLSPAVHKRESQAVSETHPRPIQMMYLPPEPAPKPKPPEPVKPREQPKPRPPEPPPPTPAFAEAKPTPSQDLPIPGTEKKVPDHDEPVATAPQPGKPKPASTETPEAEDPMVSEARRLFGPPSPPEGTLAGPVQTGLPLGIMSGGRRCPFTGAQVEESERERPAEGVIEGVVRTESGGHPIPGALLQILGTGTATIADGGGHYRLVFDPSLVDACRSQLVRVTAPGYRARTMILAWGNGDNVIDLQGR